MVKICIGGVITKRIVFIFLTENFYSFEGGQKEELLIVKRIIPEFLSYFYIIICFIFLLYIVARRVVCGFCNAKIRERKIIHIIPYYDDIVRKNLSDHGFSSRGAQWGNGSRSFSEDDFFLFVIVLSRVRVVGAV